VLSLNSMLSLWGPHVHSCSSSILRMRGKWESSVTVLFTRHISLVTVAMHLRDPEIITLAYRIETNQVSPPSHLPHSTPQCWGKLTRKSGMEYRVYSIRKVNQQQFPSKAQGIIQALISRRWLDRDKRDKRDNNQLRTSDVRQSLIGQGSSLDFSILGGGH